MIEDTIVTLINQVGFPIVAFFLMYKMAQTTIKDNTTAILELSKMIREKK